MMLGIGLAVLVGCSPSFYNARSPSGAMASDMPFVPWGKEFEGPIHRLGPVKSDLSCDTAAERLASIRKEAWRKYNADGIVEVTQGYAMRRGKQILRFSGTAVRFVGQWPEH